ncbi:probable plastid-lipid-associated protein 10, chloroplastic isoform X2 [Nymphaea colorata]|uniref:probable plastid-lipid-associated protein 10, chloroplastic isoform X2 n=1 Tax=Nymphaea colorata TaxID=210225 RepID=UPI00129E732F|nr:probable plastid-lipid-associated protein 10, chloroplastic isoform X2 [Nymphaea colorata]
MAMAFGKCLSHGLFDSHKRVFSLALRKKTHTNLLMPMKKSSQCLAAELERTKLDLLRAVQDTQRGFVATPDERASIEEILVKLECCDSGAAIDLQKLDGTWRLQYTSASDVLVLLDSSERFSFFQVGQIFQKFECRDQVDGGIVQNVVRWSIPSILEENEGATLLVTAKFKVVSKRNIYLQFEEVGLGHVKINENLQALIAPAILPRTFLSLQILQFIRSFKTQISLRSPARRSVGGLYFLSYLDRDMLLGRALGGGGVFVFTRAQPLSL